MSIAGRFTRLAAAALAAVAVMAGGAFAQTITLIGDGSKVTLGASVKDVAQQFKDLSEGERKGESGDAEKSLGLRTLTQNKFYRSNLQDRTFYFYQNKLYKVVEDYGNLSEYDLLRKLTPIYGSTYQQKQEGGFGTSSQNYTWKYSRNLTVEITHLTLVFFTYQEGTFVTYYDPVIADALPKKIEAEKERLAEAERAEEERARQEEQARYDAERAAERAKQAEQYIESGIAAHNNGNFEEAIRWYHSALENNPNANIHEYLEKAEQELEREKQELQERIRQERVRQEQERARQEQVRQEAERELMEQERREQALQNHIKWGIEFHTKGDFNSAIGNYNKALQIDPNADVYEYLELAKKKKKLKIEPEPKLYEPPSSKPRKNTSGDWLGFRVLCTGVAVGGVLWGLKFNEDVKTYGLEKYTNAETTSDVELARENIKELITYRTVLYTIGAVGAGVFTLTLFF